LVRGSLAVTTGSDGRQDSAAGRERQATWGFAPIRDGKPSWKVDVAAMADSSDNYDEVDIVYGVDDPVIADADAILIGAPEFLAAMGARVVC
jgi:hypothetical protein